jgi:hypothetical protein
MKSEGREAAFDLWVPDWEYHAFLCSVPHAISGKSLNAHVNLRIT